MRPLVLSQVASYVTCDLLGTRCDWLGFCKIWGAVLKHVCFSRHFAYVASDITLFHITLTHSIGFVIRIASQSELLNTDRVLLLTGF